MAEKDRKLDLAYINHRLFAGDNGRVLGYDNAHNFHHRHSFGEVTPVQFVNLESIEARFEEELMELLQEARK